MIDKDQIIARTIALYEKAVGYKWDGVKAPEQRPQISCEVRALAEALVEAINAQDGDK